MKLIYLTVSGVVIIVATAATIMHLWSRPQVTNKNAEPKESPQRLTMLMVGDIMLDRHIFSIAKKSNNFSYPFERITPLLEGSDLAIANLEGTITANDSVAVDSGTLRFTFSPQFIPALAERFQIFSLANNHALDFGKAGLSQTRIFLQEANISIFGDPQNKAGVRSTIVSKNDFTIGLVGYHALWKLDTEAIVSEIEKIKPQVHFVIIYPHWGIEYELSPSPVQIKEAHEFIDAGADVIIGSHPHVVQTIELYKNKPIFYSIGNFIFDQYWSEETVRGLAVRLVLEKKDGRLHQTYELLPTHINNTGQPGSAPEAEVSEVLERIATQSAIPDSFRKLIREGLFTL